MLFSEAMSSTGTFVVPRDPSEQMLQFFSHSLQSHSDYHCIHAMHLNSKCQGRAHQVLVLLSRMDGLWSVNLKYVFWLYHFITNFFINFLWSTSLAWPWITSTWCYPKSVKFTHCSDAQYVQTVNHELHSLPVLCLKTS